MGQEDLQDDEVLVFSMYITVKGKRIYRKDKRPFRFIGKKRKD
jgi:hypothetical protein